MSVEAQRFGVIERIRGLLFKINLEEEEEEYRGERA